MNHKSIRFLMVLFLITIFTSLNLVAAPSELVELRIQTKNLVDQRHCYNCHSPEGKRPLDRAMKIYNLANNQWFGTMTDRQLLEFKKRIFDQLSPEELKEMGGDPKARPLSQKQKAIVSRFVDLEIANRKQNPLEQILDRVRQ